MSTESMADVFSPEAVTAGVLRTVRRNLFARGDLGIGKLESVLYAADLDGMCSFPLKFIAI